MTLQQAGLENLNSRQGLAGSHPRALSRDVSQRRGGLGGSWPWGLHPYIPEAPADPGSGLSDLSWIDGRALVCGELQGALVHDVGAGEGQRGGEQVALRDPQELWAWALCQERHAPRPRKSTRALDSLLRTDAWLLSGRGCHGFPEGSGFMDEFTFSIASFSPSHLKFHGLDRPTWMLCSIQIYQNSGSSEIVLSSAVDSDELYDENREDAITGSGGPHSKQD
ncbi:hypothetical protein MG293_006049 [Ovis ammon polii]|uniref:Uncharacterized protein n=1 Tax=Ovis ammon polii TaxID=230172 RepID=A0AAD4UFT1_OVIAM|nr:hypothetical protein MG293_006049 [Ovis ammon polii]